MAAILLGGIAVPAMVMTLISAYGAGVSGGALITFFLIFIIFADRMRGIFRSANEWVGYNPQKLVEMGGKEAVSELINSLKVDAAIDARMPVYQTLSKLLPLLTAADAQLLSTDHRDILNKLLLVAQKNGDQHNYYLDLKLAILKAYEQIGDEAAIPVVERLAKLNVGEHPLGKAARECLPKLRASAAVIRSGQTLLRPSSQKDEEPNRLLRAASSVGTSDPDQLLRPSTIEIDN